MRASHESHERTETWRGEGAGKEESRHVGLKVAIQHRSPGEEIEVGA